MIKLFCNIGRLLTLQEAAEKQARRVQLADLSVIPKAAMVVKEDRILWCGPEADLSAFVQKSGEEVTTIDLQGRDVLPGLVDCHSHLIFAGHRAHEFEMRMQGASYQDIARQGGGILNTVKATREASEDQLFAQALGRVKKYLAQGVTTIEVKSGYGLDKQNELKMLRVVHKLAQADYGNVAGKVIGKDEGEIEVFLPSSSSRSARGTCPRIVPTFLGAHAVPPEFSLAAEYLDYLNHHVLSEARLLASRLDIFIENRYFDLSAKQFLINAQKMGFDLVIHADQLSRSGGSSLAVELGARSADHLLEINYEDIQNLASSQVTCVLLPTADLYMKSKYPPARALLDRGARVALATDFNPGSSPSQSVNLAGVLARTQMGMSLPEVVVAFTLGGAYALGLGNEIGALVPGRKAEFIAVADWTQMFFSV